MKKVLNEGMRPLEDAKKRLLWALLSTLLFSMLANGFSYFNFYPTHDAVDFTIGGQWLEWQVQLGRFLIPVYLRLRTPISMPWLTGLLSMAYLGLGVYIVADMLGLNTRLGIALTAGFLSANLFMLEINTAQQYFSDIFLFSMLLAGLGMYCVWKGRGWRSIAGAAACLFVSFGTYQASITFAACLCMLAMIRALVTGEGSVKTLLGRTAMAVAVVAVAGAAYLAVSKLVLRGMDLEPATSEWSIYTAMEHGLAELWDSIKHQYLLFYRVFLDGRRFVGVLFARATGLLAVMGAALMAWRLWKRPVALLCVLALFALFPLVSRLVNAFTMIDGAFRTMYAQFLIWPALVAVILWCLPEKARLRLAVVAATALLSVTIIVGNIRYTNGAFTVQRVLNERAMYHTGRVLEDMDEYDTSKKLVLIGRFYLDAPNDDLMKKYSRINGFKYDTGADGPYEFVHYAALLGYSLWWDPDFVAEARGLVKYKEMPAYPEKGYIVELDDYLVVKLGQKAAHEAG